MDFERYQISSSDKSAIRLSVSELLGFDRQVPWKPFGHLWWCTLNRPYLSRLLTEFYK